jgi:hypothetical protein
MMSNNDTSRKEAFYEFRLKNDTRYIDHLCRLFQVKKEGKTNTRQDEGDG